MFGIIDKFLGLFRKEPEKPNYVKIVVTTLSIIAAIAAAGYGVYLYCKKKGIRCCVCKSENFDDTDYEDNTDDVDVEVEVEDETVPVGE